MNRKEYISNFIQKVFLLLAGIQIILGLFWTVGNCRNAPIGVLQLIVAIGAYYYFLKHGTGRLFVRTKKGIRLLLAAYVATFPIVLQCHMKELPYSPASSLLLIVLADLMRLLKERGKRQTACLIRLGICWLGMGLLELAYGVMAGVAIAAVFLLCVRRKWVQWLPLLLITVLVIAGIGVGSMVIRKLEGERTQSSISSVMLSRFVWPYFVRNCFFWEPEVRALFDDGKLIELSIYPEKVLSEFVPLMEEHFGEKRAREIFRKMAWDSFRVGKKDTLTGIGRDMLANAGGPVSVQCQLNGYGASYTGKYYTQMKAEMPVFTKYFVRYAFYVFDVMAVAAVFLYVWIMCRNKQKSEGDRDGDSSDRTAVKSGILVITVSTMIIFWYTMVGNGMQNYLQVIPISIFWCMIPVLGYGLLQK